MMKAPEDRLHVLLVDDEDSFRLVVKEVLSSLRGYQVIDCDSGEAAIQALKQDQFEIVILDYKMPEISGLNVLQWMNEQKMETPVIMLTAAGSETVAVEAMKLGAYDYVRKELVDIDHLPIIIKGVYERYLFRKEKEQREKEEQDLKIRMATIEMFHETVKSIAHYVNNALSVLEMHTLNQEYYLKNHVPSHQKEQVEKALGEMRAEFKIISIGIKALIGFSDIVYNKPGIEKEMPKIQKELQNTLRDLQTLGSPR